MRLIVSKNSCLNALSACGGTNDNAVINAVVINIVPKMNFFMLVFDIDKEWGFNLCGNVMPDYRAILSSNYNEAIFFVETDFVLLIITSFFLD